ncbi:hypothetical protein [Methylobacterium sp. JK268]
MWRATILSALMVLSAPACWAQGSVGAPVPTGVPATGTRELGKADRKAACTAVADREGLRGRRRQQYRAACRGRPIPRG